MKERIAISWSGGKDSALALYKLLQEDKYIVDSLFTTVTEGYNRISMHGVPESLLEKQAESLGFPLRKVYIPQACINEVYQERMREKVTEMKAEGIQTFMFGDIFLEDVRKYREESLQQAGMKAVFPLWGRKTDELVHEFFSLGFRTITTCVDTEVISDTFLGRVMDEAFIEELPEHADPCGENGEFHTFAFDGPIFKKQVEFVKGENVDRGRFHFCELLERE
ncbi:diphthine--ammonia ligase [Fictibacillus aquaticus]|uniref:ATP-binding protein n=1 Tax=Fictibacillus aquaticus TaxID=2021314 RepID=A0A235F7I5_9BACL|nr:diphthine--ammonia ligase [Fictibacillus aquaticus]OYD57208.1 ATP-binding protein [Fictibacillus aquaticus]